MPLAPLITAFESRPLSSTTITSLSQYYGPLRHPDNPVQSSPITGWYVPCHCQGFPCCRFSLLACVPVPVPRRKQTSAHVTHFPICHQPSLIKWVDFRIARFEACSAFTHIPARKFAESSLTTLLSRVLQTMSLPPWSALAATNRSDSCWAGFAPAREKHLSTAHEICGLAAIQGSERF